MNEEPNIKTLNHKFEITGDYEFISRPATQKEVDDARKDSRKGEWMAIGRSCWECNGAHVRLIPEKNMNCFGCGKLFHEGVDITDYAGSIYEKHSHLIK